MSYEFTITPRDLLYCDVKNVKFVNAYVNKIIDLLTTWQPVAEFPKSKEISIAYDKEGRGSITFHLEFISFLNQEIADRAIISMMKQEGLDRSYYFSSSMHKVEGPLLHKDNSIYGYPVKYFPEFDTNPRINEQTKNPRM